MKKIDKCENSYVNSQRVGFTYIDPVYLDLNLEFIHDWEMIERLLNYYPSQYLPAWCATRQFWKKIVSRRGQWFSCLPEELKKDRELIMSAVQAEDFEIFSLIPIELVNDIEFMRECIKVDGNCLMFCKDEHVKEELNFEAVAAGFQLNFLKRDNEGKVIDFGDQYNDDKEVVLENVRRNGRLFEKVSARLKNDKEVIIEAMKTYRSTLSCLSNEMQQDMEIISAAIENNQFQTLKYYFESKNYVKDYEKDVEIICKVLSRNNSDYGYIAQDYKLDKELHSRILHIHTSFIDRFPKEILDYVILDAVKNPPTGFLPFSSASKSLKSDEEFVKQVIEIDPNSIIVADANIKRNRNIALQAVKKRGRVLQFLQHFRKDRQIVSAAFEQMTQNKLSKDEFDLLVEESMNSSELIPIHTRQLLEIVAKFHPSTITYMDPKDTLHRIASKYCGAIPPAANIEELPMLFEERLEYEYYGFYLPPQYKSLKFN